MRKALYEPRTGRGKRPDAAGNCPHQELRVRFFGDFEVLHRGEVVDLGRSLRAGAIFKRLLAQSPHPVSQEVLMEWLWPESSPQRAKWSLNSAVYTLRKVLDENMAEDLSSCVVLDAGRYHLSSELRLSSDVREFDTHHEQGRLLERSGEIEEAILEYEGAAGLYRDDYLVEDLYED